MKIESRMEGSVAVVSPAGRLDGAGARVLEAKLVRIAGRSQGRTVLDCRETAYVSSAGLRALLVGAKACVQAGGELVVAALRPECRAVLETSGLLLVLGYHKTVEAALAASARNWSPSGEAALEIEERREGDVAVLSLKGRLDTAGAPVLMQRFSTVVGRGTVHLLLECTDMSYINSIGLRAVLIGAKACRQQGGKFAIAALTPQCRSVMAMSGFLSVIDCRETYEAALAALASPE